MNAIPNESRPNLVWFEPQFSTICSVGRRPFWGTIRFEYKPNETLLEFVSVEEWIGTLALQKVVVEDVARLAFNEARRVLGDVPLRVTVFAETTVHAPASAQVSEGEW